MTEAAIQARRHSLARLERAAGQAFGCPDDTQRPAASRGVSRLTPTVVALVALTVAVAATIVYLV